MTRRLTLRSSGFTLIEVLVVLLIMSVLAASAWQGLDAMSRARQVADDNLRQTLRLQSVMTQLEADLAQVVETTSGKGMQFDGASLRLTRRSPEGVRVVVWSLREGRLQRWVSAASFQVGALQTQWRQAAVLQGREPQTLVALMGVAQWQVYCFRGGVLGNCQSSGDVAAGASAAKTGGMLPEQLPDAVRIQLVLADGSGFAGTVTRDLMLPPPVDWK